MAESTPDISVFVFALNNPVSFNDPTGLASEESKKEPPSFEEIDKKTTDRIAQAMGNAQGTGYHFGYSGNQQDEVPMCEKDDDDNDKRQKKGKNKSTNQQHAEEQSVQSEEIPLSESIIPIWGAGRHALKEYNDENYFWASFYSVMAISDIALIKSLAVGLVRGTWKLGAHSWSATRTWMLKRGYAKANQPLHHWAISQSFAKKNGLEWLANQPWNLKLFSSQSMHMRAGHNAQYLGLPPFSLPIRMWLTTPNYIKLSVFSGSGRVPTLINFQLKKNSNATNFPGNNP